MKGEYDYNISREEYQKVSNVSNKNIKYFFSILLQPFIYTFPISVIHLTKSLNGHFSLKEGFDIYEIFKAINMHPNFSAHFLAADGETALDQLHRIAFQIYESHLKKFIDGEIDFGHFISYVKIKCIVLPILDVFHGVKSGRNKIIENIIKIGEKCNLISADEMIKVLGIDDATLTDKTSIGKMNDEYPIHLFQIENVIKEFHEKHEASALYL